MAKIVEAEGYVCDLPRAFPAHLPAVHRFRRDDFVGAQLALVSGESVFLMRKNIVLGKCSGEYTAPVG